jgi:hypothetical protein
VVAQYYQKRMRAARNPSQAQSTFGGCDHGPRNRALSVCDGLGDECSSVYWTSESLVPQKPILYLVGSKDEPPRLDDLLRCSGGSRGVSQRPRI